MKSTQTYLRAGAANASWRLSLARAIHHNFAPLLVTVEACGLSRTVTTNTMAAVEMPTQPAITISTGNIGTVQAQRGVLRPTVRFAIDCIPGKPILFHVVLIVDLIAPTKSRECKF